jgi:phage baseplate assembly protein W
MSDDISIIRYTELPQKGAFRQQHVDFTFGKRTKTVSGILKLVQMVTKLMLTTPGTDHFSPELGTVIPSLLKRGVSHSSVQVIKMDIMASLQDLERQIQDIQAAEVIPDDERLQDVITRRVEYLPASAEWIIEISISSLAGERVSFDITPYLKGR